MKDKELIENSRLRERTGGYHKYVDAAEVHNPDPTSSHFISGKCCVLISNDVILAAVALYVLNSFIS